MSHHSDVLVLGLGGMGCSAAWRLAQRGLSVRGIEQFAIGHANGSSHGHTRIIRQAYYEHPAYVPLARRAYQGWYELELDRGEHLLTSCPCLTLGTAEGELVIGVRRSANEHSLPIEDLSRPEITRRYPAFHLNADSNLVGVVEHTAGFLYVDRCVSALADAARSAGAMLHENEPVLDWKRVGEGVEVRTSVATYRAARLVITAGPWANRLLGASGRSLTVMKQMVFWLPVGDSSLFRRDRFPLFIADTPGGYFYGIPQLDRRGPKIARHYGADELASVEAIDRTISASDVEPVRTFARNYLPAADGPPTDSGTCIYTLTPDRHFLIDLHPEGANVAFAAGFSGHGFKFAPVIGEILAELVIEGRTDWPIDLFALQRFASSKS